MERALAIFERSHGPDHLVTAQVRRCLLRILRLSQAPGRPAVHMAGIEAEEHESEGAAASQTASRGSGEGGRNEKLLLSGVEAKFPVPAMLTLTVRGRFSLLL